MDAEERLGLKLTFVEIYDSGCASRTEIVHPNDRSPLTGGGKTNGGALC